MARHNNGRVCCRHAILFCDDVVPGAYLRAQAAADLRATYTKTEHMVAMRDGVKLFTIVYTPKDTSDHLSLHAAPDAVRIAAVWSGHVSRVARAVTGLCGGEVHLRLPGRAREVPLRRRVRRHAAARAGAEGAACHRREHGHLRHHRLAREEHPEQQRPRRAVGDFVSRIADRLGHDRRPSGAQGVVAAGAGDRHVPRRRLPSQRRVPIDVHVQLAGGQRPAARGHDRNARRRLRLRHAGRLSVLPRRRPGREHQREVLQLQRADVERVHGPPELRRVLAAAESAEACQEHHARRAERRRLVRRRGLLRSARDVPRGRALDPRQQEPHRHRPLAAWRLGVDARRRAWRHPLRIADRRVLPHRDRAAVLQAPLEGPGRRRRRPKPRCSKPAAIGGGPSTRGRPRASSRGPCISIRKAGSRSRRHPRRHDRLERVASSTSTFPIR